jgi:hypothetical protein
MAAVHHKTLTDNMVAQDSTNAAGSMPDQGWKGGGVDSRRVGEQTRRRGCRSST